MKKGIIFKNKKGKQKIIPAIILLLLISDLLSACVVGQHTPATPTPLPATKKPFTTLALQLLSTEAKTYSLLEFAVHTDGMASNPFDPVEVDLIMQITAPNGETISVPAFWYQEYDPQTLNPIGEPGWRVRFTPNTPGTWTVQAALANPALESPPFAVEVAEDVSAHGFLRIHPQDPRYFALDDGTFFFPVGLNMSWSTGDVLEDYRRWLDIFSQNGGNFIRLWMASWSFAVEAYDTGLGNYANRLKQAWLLDQVLQMAEERGIYVMICLINHGAFSKTTNAEWQLNPYNAALGGPLSDPGDFVTDPIAKDLFQRRLRYIAARWAAYPSLGAWEWWNEVNWTPIRDKKLEPWIAEMTAELQKYDPYRHLISTSYANGTRNSIWSMPQLSFAQQHDYSARDPIVALGRDRAMLQKKAGDKPALLSEYGSATDGESTPENRDGIHLHNGLWAAPFSGYAGTAMYWWWDTYIDPFNLWYHYHGVSSFFKGENLIDMLPSQTKTIPPRAVVLILSNPQRALVWLRDENYTVQDAKSAYKKAVKRGNAADWRYSLPAQENLTLTIAGLEDGSYQIICYSTLDGEPIGEPMEAVSEKGSLVIAIPRFQFDLAVKVIKTP